jgi:SecD/SecF fusion protein
VLADFALAIIIGIIVGTYSSIFVAAPVVLWWSKRTGRSIKREVLGDPETAAA